MQFFLIVGSFSLFSGSAYALDDSSETSTQEVKKPSFNSENDLPKSGEIGLGFNAVPLLNFGLNLVNVMNDTGDKAGGMATYPAGGEQAITAKYFLSDQQAIRIRVGLNHSSGETETLYEDPVVDPEDNDEPDTLSDKARQSSSTILLGGGMEFRRSKGRLVGLYGGEAFLSFGGNSTSTQYGWSYSQDAYDYGVIVDGDERLLSNRSGTTVGIGLRGFAGVEYFLAPKISISAEFGWALAFTSTGQGEVASEVWVLDEEGNGSVITTVDKTGGSSGTRVGHDNGADQNFAAGSGAINLMFHF